ncbi:hypothetical protein [Rossellomorea vietnamensis]|nr:hypothetical protein [Rossellomorea vietnamensis]
MSILSELDKLVKAGSNEQKIQTILKKDLSLFAKAYAKPEDE